MNYYYIDEEGKVSEIDKDQYFNYIWDIHFELGRPGNYIGDKFIAVSYRLWDNKEYNDKIREYETNNNRFR